MADQPPLLTRMTLKYDANEDRVCVSGELETGEVISLRLTRRLLNNLLPHLIRSEVLMQTGEGQSGDVAPRIEKSADDTDKINVPVTVHESTQHVLVTSVDFSKSSGCVVLDWKDRAESKRARLVLSKDLLSEWLTALRTCFVNGCWTQEAWGSELSGICSSPEEKPVTVH